MFAGGSDCRDAMPSHWNESQSVGGKRGGERDIRNQGIIKDTHTNHLSMLVKSILYLFPAKQRHSQLHCLQLQLLSTIQMRLFNKATAFAECMERTHCVVNYVS